MLLAAFYIVHSTLQQHDVHNFSLPVWIHYKDVFATVMFLIAPKSGKIYKWLLINFKWVIFKLIHDDFCHKQFTFLMKWWWLTIFIRPTCWVEIFSASSQYTETTVHRYTYCSTWTHYPNSANQSALTPYSCTWLAEQQEFFLHILIAHLWNIK